MPEEDQKERYSEKTVPWLVWAVSIVTHSLFGPIPWPEAWYIGALIGGFVGADLVQALKYFINHEWWAGLFALLIWVVMMAAALITMLEA